jgi:PAS domain S-box-containing protein
MEIDIRTIVIILGFTHLMQMLVFIHQFKVNKIYQGTGWWLLWSAAEVIGFGVMLLRNIPSILPMVIIIQNSMIVAGTIFLYIGVRSFFNMRINLKVLISIVLVFFTGLLYFLFIVNDIHIRSGFTSAALAVISLFTAHSLLLNKNRSITASANFLATIFLVHSGIFIYRTMMIFTGTQIENIFTPSLFNILPYFDALIVSLLWTFGFIIMLNQRLNAEISEAKEDLEVIFNTSPDAALITRLDDGRIVEINEGYTAISGYTPQEMSGKSTPEINIWKNIVDRQKVVSMLKENRYFENYEAVFVRKDGVEITGLMSAKIINLQGIPHIISITRDITQRKLAEKELELKNEQLLKLNAEKDKFFSIIAHDLRSPFTGFLGLTKIMTEELPTMTLSQLQKIAESLRNSASNLFGLLENLLQWSRIQQGLIPFTPEKIPLIALVEESLETTMELAKNKNITIINEISDTIEVFVDVNMLQTVIRNLVSNAVKFTPKGGIINIEAKSKENKKIQISIKDNGIGMSNKILENLFKLDKQTSRKGTEGEPSTGLGLILCVDFIEKHGGKIWAESNTDGISGEKGSTFYFTVDGNIL